MRSVCTALQIVLEEMKYMVAVRSGSACLLGAHQHCACL